MELAINTIFLFFFLIFPGIVFRRFYFQGPFSKQFKSSSWFKTLINSLFPGVIIQYITFSTFFSIIPKNISNGINFKLVISDLVKNTIPESIDREFIIYVLVYFVLVLAISFILARISFFTVRSLKWDHKFPLFRFKNYWHYYFRGEIIAFEDFKDLYPNSKVVLVQADILTQLHDGKTRLFKGTLRQYNTCFETGKLKEVFLTDTKRYSNKKDQFVTVPGDLLIIPYEKVLNINLRYVIKMKNKKDYLYPMLFILSSIILVIFFVDEFDLYNNSNLLYAIIIRFLMLLDWLFINTFLASLFDKKTNFSSKRGGLIVILLFIIIVTLLLHKGQNW